MWILRTIGYSFMALVLAGGLAFIYWQSGSGVLAAVDATRLALAELRAVDAGWNRQLANLRIAAGGKEPGASTSPYAGAPSADQRARQESSRLRRAHVKLESRMLPLGIPGAGFELAKLRYAFEDKEDLLARLVETVAARNDAQRALPADPAKPTELAELSAAADALLERASLAETGPRLDTLSRAVDQVSDRALGEAELYRVALLYYSGFLLAVLVFLTWSLAQRGRQIDLINSRLRDANEFLEARVAERTSELTATLARLKESEAMLIQSEKMSSLGQMVAGIAHEVNTPLAYVKSSLEAVSKSVPEASRLADQTRRLLALLADEGVDETALATQFSQVQALIDQLSASVEGQGAFDELQRLVKDGLFGIGQISEVITNLKNFSRLDRSKAAAYDLHEGIESAIRIGHQLQEPRRCRRSSATIPAISVFAFTDQPGISEPRHQCGAGHARSGRNDHRPHRNARQRSRDGRGERQWTWHTQGYAAEDFRSVFHDQAGREGHRAGAFHRLQDRGKPRWAHRGRFEAGRRHAISRDPACQIHGRSRGRMISARQFA